MRKYIFIITLFISAIYVTKAFAMDNSGSYNVKRQKLINQTLDMIDNQHVSELQRNAYKAKVSYPQNIYASEPTVEQTQPNTQIAYVAPKEKKTRQEIVKEALDEFYPKMQEIELETGYYGYSYKEPGVMNHKGGFWEIGAALTYRTKKNEIVKNFRNMISDTNSFNMYRLELEAAYGIIDYDSDSTGSIDNVDNFKFGARALIGIDTPISKTTVLTPYSGLGFRFLQDDKSGLISSTGASGYDRKSHYFYLPLGIDVESALNNDYYLGLNFEYDYLFFGRQQSCLSDVSANYPNIDNDQKHGFGLKSSIKLAKRSENADVFLEPFVRYWNISKSDKINYTADGNDYVAWEPKNNTTEVGIKFGIDF